MGVEYIGVCHKCKSWIDGHKCWSAADMVRKAKEGRVPTYSDFETWSKYNHWWGTRLIWFMLKHNGHETDLYCDCSDDEKYFEYQGRYTEESNNDDILKQRSKNENSST